MPTHDRCDGCGEPLPAENRQPGRAFECEDCQGTRARARRDNIVALAGGLMLLAGITAVVFVACWKASRETDAQASASLPPSPPDSTIAPAAGGAAEGPGRRHADAPGESRVVQPAGHAHF